ncbi:MAG TPA: gas vesicle protein GvpG [Solirubrobacteraceae bacterium]|jgi:hypothetical protein
MGLFTGLLTLPLAPVRGAAWVVQQVADEAERQADDQSQLRRQLLQLELDRDAGLIDDDDYERASDTVLDQIAQGHANAVVREESTSSLELGDG